MYALRYLVKPHPFQMHLIFCTIFSIFSTLWPLAWPFAMQISLLLFKIGGESCTLYTIVGFVFQLNFLQDLMLDMKMGSWLGIKICLVMLELDSWCTSFDTFFGTKISNVSNSLYNTSTYIHNAQYCKSLHNTAQLRYNNAIV